ncbi:histone-fold-containing protein [Scheffersomyces xylosifermentans]|uniref:histone-fold-containing protein n=1 Tax=Scheffersomyces xylosifermentans TaxID=1304137 RepID=UPI00315CA3C8
MADLSSLMNNDDDYSYSYNPAMASALDNSSTNGQTVVEEEKPRTNEVTQEKILESFEKIKTHFPAARIKKIMQSDDEVGKVAQATPIIVGRALEIFMANLVEVSILEARKQGVKRISASHIRSAIENTEQFDFLVEAVEKYPPVKN